MAIQTLYTAATVFGLVSLLHWVRYFLRTEITVGSAAIPVSASLIFGIIAAGLAVWMIFASRRI